MVSSVFPFAAIVGQDEMKLALILNVIDPLLGGVLIMGHRGTAKSTAVRGLAALLPEIWVVRGCPFRCDPANPPELCAECRKYLSANAKLPRERSNVAVVDLPLGATEDRVSGSIDIERALKNASKTFEPGLIARANRGFLYIDEVNLLEDHLVDLLLDVAVTGKHRVEREGISVQHPARFVLIGSGNPEEGELRPQLLDRFGLHVEVTTENDPEQRAEIVERCESFETDREGFLLRFKNEQEQIRKRIARARQSFASLKIERLLLRKVATLCTELKLDGHRGELTVTRAARALASFEKRKTITEEDVRRVALISLRHRLRREPFEETASNERIKRALDKVFGAGEGSGSPEQPSGNGQPRHSSSESRKQNSSNTETASSSKAGGANVETKLPPIEQGSKLNLKIANGHSRLWSRTPFRNGHSSSNSKLNSQRGRYSLATSTYTAGARVALDATLRAIATSGSRCGSFQTDALRFKRFKRKHGTLFILAIDTSGSMAQARINRAREVALGLLRESYIKRDSVAIVVFRGTTAEVALSASRSMLRAKRALDGLSVGGSTPLSAGILRAIEVARRAALNNGDAKLLLFTDGHANVALRTHQSADRETRELVIAGELRHLGEELERSNLKTIVIETESGFTSDGGSQRVAEQLRAQFIRVG